MAPYRARLDHPRWGATDVTVHRLDGTTALISDNAQRVRRGGVMVPPRYPQRWWVCLSTIHPA